jgi:hypothetical protein
MAKAKEESRLLPGEPLKWAGDNHDKKTVEIPCKEVIDILTIIKGFERKLQGHLKKA